MIMKLKYILMLFILTLMSCYAEDKLVVPAEKPQYDISDSSDPLQHERYLLYKDFEVILVDNPDSSDYLYTMGAKSKYVISSLGEGMKDEKVKAIKFIRKVFYDNLAKDFMKENAHLKLIIASNIEDRKPDSWDDAQQGTFYPRTYEILMSEYFIAITVDDRFLSSLEDEEFANDYKSEIMSEFLVENIIKKKLGQDYMYDQFAALNLDDDALYDYNGVYISYGLDFEYGDRPYEEFLAIEDHEDFVYGCGVPPSITTVIDDGPPYMDEWDYPSGGAFIRAKNRDYVVGFINWSGTTPAAEKERILAKYPKFKERFEVAKSLLKQYINYDL